MFTVIAMVIAFAIGMATTSAFGGTIGVLVTIPVAFLLGILAIELDT